jgi:hypothetical protein
MIQTIIKTTFLFCAMILILGLYSCNAQQDSIVEAPEFSVLPLIDGRADDPCWDEAKWQAIDQVWIPWNAYVAPDDFSGRYKVGWSSATNLMYFIVEITDDVISDAYQKGVSSAIYNFDMFEIFIDENKSGGYHVFDGTANDETSLGTNAENAFAYHIIAKIPVSGESSHDFIVSDIAGESWSNPIDPDYSHHFPDFIVRREGNTYTFELSMIVFDDTYSLTNEANSRVQLSKGKVMGLTLAANDNDKPEVDPAHAERKNMIGSVAVTQQAYNDHWKNADGFGTVKLVSTLR